MKHLVYFKILFLTFCALHGQTRVYLFDHLKSYSTSQILRSSDQNLLIIPRTCFKTRGDRSFKAVVPGLWNYFPLPLCSVDSVNGFKKLIFLMKRLVLPTSVSAANYFFPILYSDFYFYSYFCFTCVLLILAVLL